VIPFVEYAIAFVFVTLTGEEEFTDRLNWRMERKISQIALFFNVSVGVNRPLLFRFRLMSS
jgi:hypothetical protein